MLSAQPGPAAIVLSEHRILRIGGTQRESFLQGQLTQDVARASLSATTMAGWADAKGRLAWAGHLFARDDGLCMLVPAALCDTLARRLQMFVLRAKAEVQVTDLLIVGIDASLALPALPADWQRLTVARDTTRHMLVGPATGDPEFHAALAAARSDVGRWRLSDVRAGLPEIAPATSAAFVPQMINLDLLDGISFSKGCYTGQEIVARTKYLGRVKRRMLRFAADGVTPAAGEPVFGDRGVVGQVALAATAEAGTEILAVISLEDLSGPLYLDESRQRPLQALPLPYPIPELGR